jgi:hypothetical protein
MESAHSTRNFVFDSDVPPTRGICDFVQYQSTAPVRTCIYYVVLYSVLYIECLPEIRTRSGGWNMPHFFFFDTLCSYLVGPSVLTSLVN